MKSFPFISDTILQSNLDTAQQHIVDLTLLSLSNQYKRKRILRSSLRKTIIILTASTIEALLLWKLKAVCNSGNIELDDEWKYLDIRTIHIINDSEEVIAGKRKKERKVLDRLDFIYITNLCIKYKILRSVKLKTDIDLVRKLRNRLHIGGLAEIEKGYTRKNLEFCFNVQRRVMKLVS